MLSHWLVCYDVVCPKRLQKICKFMKAKGFHLQASVFYLRASQREIDALIEDLSVLMDQANDDIRIYHVAPLTQARMMGSVFDAFPGVMGDLLDP